MKTLSALDLRKRLGTILNEVSREKEPVIISRANKPSAVLISVDDFELKVLKKKSGGATQGAIPAHGRMAGTSSQGNEGD